MARILVWMLWFGVLIAGVGCTSHPARPQTNDGLSKEQPPYRHQHGRSSKQPTRELVFPTQPPPKKAK
jgi:hypothetical protein